MEKVRIGFVGAGFMGLLARLERRIAERYRIPKIYEPVKNSVPKRAPMRLLNSPPMICMPLLPSTV